MAAITIGDISPQAFEQLRQAVARGSAEANRGAPPASSSSSSTSDSDSDDDSKPSRSPAGFTVGGLVLAPVQQEIQGLISESVRAGLTTALGPGGIENVPARLETGLRFLGAGEGSALGRGQETTLGSLSNAIADLIQGLREVVTEARAKETAREKTLHVAEHAGAGGLPLSKEETLQLYRATLDIETARARARQAAEGYLANLGGG